MLPYGEDTGIANSVTQQIAQTAQGVDELVLSTGQTQFQVTGPASLSAHYPTTENWQKAQLAGGAAAGHRRSG